MRQFSGQFRARTRGKGLYEITAEVAGWVSSQGIAAGLLTLFIQHTSASLIIQENADPDVTRDMTDYFERLVPENDPNYRHTIEGPDDMPSHIRTALTQTHLSIPVVNGRLALGAWQGIYIFEHRSSAHHRSVIAHLAGE